MKTFTGKYLCFQLNLLSSHIGLRRETNTSCIHLSFFFLMLLLCTCLSLRYSLCNLSTLIVRCLCCSPTLKRINQVYQLIIIQTLSMYVFLQVNIVIEKKVRFNYSLNPYSCICLISPYI